MAADSFGHEQDSRIGRRVRDIASGTEGELMAIVAEDIVNAEGRPMTVRLAYIRPTCGGRELPINPGNLQVIQ